MIFRSIISGIIDGILKNWKAVIAFAGVVLGAIAYFIKEWQLTTARRRIRRQQDELANKDAEITQMHGSMAAQDEIDAAVGAADSIMSDARRQADEAFHEQDGDQIASRLGGAWRDD